MKINTAVFERSSPGLAGCPRWPLPEFAFIGRSNVGKSSLINLLVARRDLAKVSDLPGKTRLINFYAINSRWSLVDLPGYGFAQGSKSERAEFNESVADFIEGRANLAHLFVLIDCRLPPQAIDLAFVEWLGGVRVPYALVFTKADKQSETRSRANMELFLARLAAWRPDPPPLFLCSAKSKAGRGEILAFIQAELEGKQGSRVESPESRG